MPIKYRVRNVLGERMNYLLSAIFAITSVSALALEVSADQVGKILKDPLVQPLYQKCSSEGKTGDKLSSCIWTELGKNPEQQQQVVDKYFNNDNTSTHYDSLDRKTISKGEDPAIRKLEDYMEKKLEEALYGDIQANKKQTAVADHAVFYRLYKSQISKNIITSISSYCIEAGSVNGLPIISSDESTRASQRKTNIEQLKDFSPNEKGDTVSDAYSQWGLCLTNLTAVCTLKPGTDEDREDRVYSKNRACVLTNYLKQLRQSLIAADAIDKQVKENDNESSGFALSNVRIYRGEGDDKTASINDLTSLSSNEFVNKSGYSKALSGQQEKIKQCIESKDMEQCKEFLSDASKKAELENALAEYDLQKRLIKSKVEKMDEDQLRDYLKEEGRTEQEIQRLLASDESIDSLKMEINRNYDAERQAIVDKMKEKIESRTVASDSKGFETEVTKLEQIQKELAQQGDDYKQLIHYNNIVSGFLSVADSSDKIVGTNVQSIQRELSDSAFDQSKDGKRSPASAGDTGYFDDLAKKLGEMVKDKDNKDQDSKHDATPISTGTINENVFKYESDPGDKKEEED